MDWLMNDRLIDRSTKSDRWRHRIMTGDVRTQMIDDVIVQITQNHWSTEITVHQSINPILINQSNPENQLILGELVDQLNFEPSIPLFTALVKLPNKLIDRMVDSCSQDQKTRSWTDWLIEWIIVDQSSDWFVHWVIVHSDWLMCISFQTIRYGLMDGWMNGWMKMRPRLSGPQHHGPELIDQSINRQS